MLNAHTADLEKINDAKFMSELAHHFYLFGGFNVLGGSKMIRHKINFLFVEYFFNADFLKFFDGWRSCNVIAEHEINFAVD